MKKRIISSAVSTVMLVSAFGAMPQTAVRAESWDPNTTKTPQYMEEARQMEALDRGLIASYSSDTNASAVRGVYLSWRLLGDESLENQAFDIYRGDSSGNNFQLIHTTEADGATNYIDTSGTQSNTYKVVKSGEPAAGEADYAVPTTNYTASDRYVTGNGYSEPNSYTYVDIPISRPDPVERPGDGKTSYYYSYDSDHEGGANDASVGDLDGDGDYELILKWDPTDSKDSAGADFTGNVYIDAYQIDPGNGGKYMWRIDLGQNVTAGAHYTQFIVYDFDGDGRSEVAMQTAPDSYVITSTGEMKYVTEAGDTEEIRSADNNALNIGMSGSSKGKNLGPEYYTIFDGETGDPLYTTDAIPLVSSNHWGDSTYNRAMRYLAGVAYLDGVRPSLIMCRGYYNRAMIRAYTFDGTALSLQWEYNSGGEGLYSQGNHNLSIADIDNDGKDEIVYGSACLDDDGKTVLGNTKLGHGDALHVNDFDNDGIQEAFSVKEDNSARNHDNGANFRIPSTGERIFGKPVEKGSDGKWPDVGRGIMDNVDDEYAKSYPNALAIGWDSYNANAYDMTGQELQAKPATSSRSMTNFLAYWDGDLGRELLDDNQLTKYDASTGTTTRFYFGTDGWIPATSNNFSKHTPSLVADIWGDWREEIIMPINKDQSSGQAYIRIFTSTIPTEYRLTTLMHDSQYRCSVAWQNVGYNQPTHTSYYIGSAALAEKDGEQMKYLAPATLFTHVGYNIGQIDMTGLELSSSELEIEKCRTAQLLTIVTPSDATRKSVIWTSSDPSVATVSNGIVTAVEVGDATITATSRYDQNISASCKVTVFSTPVTGIEMDEEMTIGVESTKQLTAQVLPENASDQRITWTSSNPAIASVDSSGKVTAHTAGAVLITAVANEGGYTAECVLNVTPLEETNITGEPGADGNSVFAAGMAEDETTNYVTKLSESGAQLNQNLSETGGSFYRTFKKLSDNKAVLSFRFYTAGQRMDGTNYNWTGHEYTLNLALMGENDQNILTLSQPYEASAGSLISRVGNDETVFSNTWTSVHDGIGNIQGSSKRWIVNIEFDYDNDMAEATVTAANNQWGTTKINDDGREVSLGEYTMSFELGGLSLEKIMCYTTVDGEGGISARPEISELSYTQLTPMEGATETLYEKGTQWYNAWESADIADWTQTNQSTASLQVDPSAAENGRIYYNPTQPGAPEYNAAKSFDIANDAIVTYDVDWYFGNATSRFTNFEYIQFGSNLRLGWTSNRGQYYVLASTDAGESYIGHTGENTAEAVTSDQALFSGSNTTYTKNVKVVYDVSSNTVLSLTFDGNTVDMFTNYTMPEGTTMDNLSFGLQRGGATDAWEYPNGLDSIRVSQFVEGATPERPTTPPEKPEPDPDPVLVPVEHKVTAFTNYPDSRLTGSEASGEENEIMFTTASNANNKFAGAYADISNFVEGEESFDVDFDSCLGTGSRARIALCDVSQRPGGSDKINYYNTGGLAFVQGITADTDFAVNGDKETGNAPGAIGVWVHTKLSVDTVDKTITYTITDTSGAVLLSGEDISYLDTSLGEINGIEFFDIQNSKTSYIKNIIVTTYEEREDDELTVGAPALTGGKVTALITNTTDEAKPVRLIVVSYDEATGALAGISLSEGTSVDANGSVILEADAPETSEYKVMVWNDLSNTQPLIRAVTELAQQ